MRVLVVFYSMYGHIYRMAQAVIEGVGQVDGARAELRRVPETLPREVLQEMGAEGPQQAFADVPVATVEELAQADAIVFGTPTRFGNMCGQMRQFLDATGALWVNGALVDKVAGVFTSSNTQHGGQESTILSVHTTLLHHGMLIAGLPYTFQGQMQTEEVAGCSPYGASTVAGAEGERAPTAIELAGARFQGERVARLAARLAAGADR